MKFKCLFLGTVPNAHALLGAGGAKKLFRKSTLFIGTYKSKKARREEGSNEFEFLYTKNFETLFENLKKNFI